MMAGAKPRFQLDMRSGVPVYRQLIDQILVAKASGLLRTGDQLPTVRQLAVDLSINPNTVVRAYKELEIRGVLSTQQGSGTFVTDHETPRSEFQREQRLTTICGEFIARASAEGFTLKEVLEQIRGLISDSAKQR